MMPESKNALVIVGPTAVGKTALGARIASLLDGEVLSADSRQVYRGLDIGSGKDLEEYVVDGKSVPYHLIDIADLRQEFSVFHYQQAFYAAFESVIQRKRLPVVVGGTGLYLDAVLCGYRMVPTPENPELRAMLAALDAEQLRARLASIRPRLHNITDMEDRERLIRAIEIAEYARNHPAPPCPEVRALILGIKCPPEVLRERIARRLRARFDAGLIEEVERLHAAGHSWERFERLGLEYRFIAEYLQGKIKNKNDLFQKLNSAIAQFAKRQRTWFRGMERKGFDIRWLPDNDPRHALKAIRHSDLAHNGETSNAAPPDNSDAD